MTRNSAKIVLKRIIFGKGYRTIIAENKDEKREIHFSMSSVFPNRIAEEEVLKILSENNE